MYPYARIGQLSLVQSAQRLAQAQALARPTVGPVGPLVPGAVPQWPEQPIAQPLFEAVTHDPTRSPQGMFVHVLGSDKYPVPEGGIRGGTASNVRVSVIAIPAAGFGSVQQEPSAYVVRGLFPWLWFDDGVQREDAGRGTVVRDTRAVLLLPRQNVRIIRAVTVPGRLSPVVDVPIR